MVLLVNSVELLLTVKAVDILDNTPRKADPNGVLMAIGFGNVISGLLGGLPMISEVVRSSANINFGAKTRWANFFHGIFLLLSLLFLILFIEMISNAALAAMLIYAGYNLASSKEFIHALHLVKEQFVFFIVTVIITFAEDLSVGIAAGLLVEMIFYSIKGTSFKNIFKACVTKKVTDNQSNIKVKVSAQFSNLIGIKNVN